MKHSSNDAQQLNFFFCGIWHNDPSITIYLNLIIDHFLTRYKGITTPRQFLFLMSSMPNFHTTSRNVSKALLLAIYSPSGIFTNNLSILLVLFPFQDPPQFQSLSPILFLILKQVDH